MEPIHDSTQQRTNVTFLFMCVVILAGFPSVCSDLQGTYEQMTINQFSAHKNCSFLYHITTSAAGNWNEIRCGAICSQYMMCVSFAVNGLSACYLCMTQQTEVTENVEAIVSSSTEIVALLNSMTEIFIKCSETLWLGYEVKPRTIVDSALGYTYVFREPVTSDVTLTAVSFYADRSGRPLKVGLYSKTTPNSCTYTSVYQWEIPGSDIKIGYNLIDLSRRPIAAGSYWGFTWTNGGVVSFANSSLETSNTHTPYCAAEVIPVLGNTYTMSTAHGNRYYSIKLQVELDNCNS